MTLLRKAREARNIFFNGIKILLYSDFSLELQKRRAEFIGIKRTLQKFELTYALLYPAWLLVVALGRTQIFDSPTGAPLWLEDNKEKLQLNWRMEGGGKEGNGHNVWNHFFFFFSLLLNESWFIWGGVRGEMHTRWGRIALSSKWMRREEVFYSIFCLFLLITGGMDERSYEKYAVWEMVTRKPLRIHLDRWGGESGWMGGGTDEKADGK